tara:strand:+ start:76 stop:927 length:852 start_codon:yes stop_codon:yes gene_type:complete
MNGDNSLFNLIFPQMNPAAAVSTGVAHDNINSLMGNGNNLNQRQDENFIKDAFQKIAYNITARSNSKAYMDESIPELIKMGLTPLSEEEYRKRYSGGEDMFWSGADKGDLLSLYLNQKSPAEAGMKEQKLRPTDISERFKNLPTYSIKDFTTVHPLNKISGHYGDKGWNTDTIKKIANLKKGEVAKLRQGEVGLNPRLDVGGYTVSAGKDDKGTYVSIYDTWDFGPEYGRDYAHTSAAEDTGNLSREIQPTLMNMVGNPFAMYDRYYIPQEQFISELKSRMGK